MDRSRVFGLLVLGVLIAACAQAPPAPRSAVPPASPSLASAASSVADLPPPYDLAGVLAALNRRQTIATIPTAEQRARARIDAEAFTQRVATIVETAYPGERARMVSVNLVVIDIHDSRFEIDHRLAYVVETTGHATGNCLTMFDASTADQFLASCFHGDRRHP